MSLLELNLQVRVRAYIRSEIAHCLATWNSLRMSGPIRKKSYSVVFKLQVVSKTETSSIRAVAREAGVDEKRVREWKKKEMKLEEMMKKQGEIACKVRKRLSGGGRKVQFPVQEKLICAPHHATENPACSCAAQGCSSLW